MPQKYFSQLDPAWDREMLGDTTYSIHYWGCLDTTVCNAIQQIYKHYDFTPKHGAELFEYLPNGKLIHDSIKFKDMEVTRVWKKPDHDVITDFTNSEHKAIGVRMAYNPLHWVLVHKWTWKWKDWFLAVDPFTYNPITRTARIVKRLKRDIDGAFLFSNSN